MPTSTTVIIAAIIAFVVGAAVSGVILFNVGVKHRKQQAEAAIGSAEKEAERIVEDAKKEAESQKKIALVAVPNSKRKPRNAEMSFPVRNAAFSRRKKISTRKMTALRKKTRYCRKRSNRLKKSSKKLTRSKNHSLRSSKEFLSLLWIRLRNTCFPCLKMSLLTKKL